MHIATKRYEPRLNRQLPIIIAHHPSTDCVIHRNKFQFSCPADLFEFSVFIFEKVQYDCHKLDFVVVIDGEISLFPRAVSRSSRNPNVKRSGNFCRRSGRPGPSGALLAGYYHGAINPIRAYVRTFPRSPRGPIPLSGAIMETTSSILFSLPREPRATRSRPPVPAYATPAGHGVGYNNGYLLALNQMR